MDSWEVLGCRMQGSAAIWSSKVTQRNCAFLADEFPQLVQNLYPDFSHYFSKDQKYTSKEHIHRGIFFSHLDQNVSKK
jgi:hypothetical protein